jgi:FkbM family methyltransferase
MKEVFETQSFQQVSKVERARRGTRLLTVRGLLRSFRHLPFLPCWLVARGYPRLAFQPTMVLWGKVMGAALRVATVRCLLRRHQDVYMSSATFASLLLRAGDSFVDVGAYDGLISLVAAQAVGGAGRVYSFEPNPVAFARLQCLARAYQLARVHTENCAVAAEEGTAVLYVPECATEATLSEKSTLTERATRTPCRVRTLEAFWREQTEKAPPTLIKIDVEGAELDVLTGAQTLLTSHTPPMVIFEASEVNAQTFGRTVDDVLNLLATFGYQFWMLRYPSLIPIKQSAEINPGGNPEFWTDVLAVNPKVHGSQFERLRRRFPAMEGRL